MPDINRKKVFKKNVERRVLVASLPDVQKEKKFRINSQLSLVNREISKSVKNLWIQTGNPIPLVTIKPFVSYSSKADMGEILIGKGVDIASYRAGIELCEFPETPNPDFIKKYGLSHIVSVKLSEKSEGWFKGENIASATVKTTLDLIPLLIHDICLDIALFHSWSWMKKLIKISLSEKIEFSKMKVQVAIENNCNTIFGPIKKPYPEYISLSSCFRRTVGIDYFGYVEAWNQLMAKFYQIDIKSRQNAAILDDDIIKEIKKNFKYWGTISEKKLRNQLAELEGPPNRHYLLVMTIRKPKNQKRRRSLASLFGKRKWGQNLFTVIPWENKEKFYKWAQYLLFYKFVR